MPKGNPSPVQTPEFRTHQYKRADATGEPLSTKQVQVKLPVSLDAIVQAMPNRSEWLRRVIAEAIQEEMAKAGQNANLKDETPTVSTSIRAGDRVYDTGKQATVKFIKPNGSRAYVELPDGRVVTTDPKNLRPSADAYAREVGQQSLL
jgi:hypothetical protein